MYFAIIFSTEKFRREKRNVPKSRKPPKSWETSQIPEASQILGNLPNSGSLPESRECSHVPRNYFSIIFSTICIAFDAAPFLILSATTQRFTPFSTLKSLLILPTKTSSCPVVFVAIG